MKAYPTGIDLYEQADLLLAALRFGVSGEVLDLLRRHQQGLESGEGGAFEALRDFTDRYCQSRTAPACFPSATASIMARFSDRSSLEPEILAPSIALDATYAYLLGRMDLPTWLLIIRLFNKLHLPLLPFSKGEESAPRLRRLVRAISLASEREEIRWVLPDSNGNADYHRPDPALVAQSVLLLFSLDTEMDAQRGTYLSINPKSRMMQAALA